jgi:hypothetical protein
MKSYISIFYREAATNVRQAERPVLADMPCQDFVRRKKGNKKKGRQPNP